MYYLCNIIKQGDIFMKTEKQKQIILALENLVHSRFNQETLEKNYPRFLMKQLNLKKHILMLIHLPDWNLIFESKQEEIGGIF